MQSTLVDAGPLIAMVDRSDRHHRPVRRFLDGYRGRLLTTWMDLADASLLWVAEQTGVCDILTIDLRDFGAYRLPGGKALTPVL